MVLPVVWLLGTSGVGKSTTGYRMLSILAAARVTAAFVDADQLRLKDALSVSETALIASALPAVAARFHRFGARVLIVAGLADDEEHLAALLPGVARRRVFAVRLTADERSIRDRVHGRGWNVDLADASVDYAQRNANGFADLRIDTTGLSASEVAARTAEAALAFLQAVAHEVDGPAGHGTPDRPPQVILITGPGGVGVSTVGFEVFMRVGKTATPVGYLDTRQLGFVGPDPGHRDLATVRAENASDVARNFARAGAQVVVIGCDHDAADPLLAQLDSDTVRTLWLDASADALIERIRSRAGGLGPALAGNERIGLAGTHVDAAVEQVIRELPHRDLLPTDTEVIDTTNLDAAQVADRVTAAHDKHGNDHAGPLR